MAPPPPPPQSPPPPPPPRGGLSLYDNIHDPNDPTPAATISAAPVMYNQANATPVEAKKPINPALRFQPQIRRPSAKQVKSKTTIPKSILQAAPVPAAGPAPPKTTLADWAGKDEEECIPGAGEKRQRGGRKNKKRRQQEEAGPTNWDDFYDPSKPTNVEEYQQSDEKVGEVLEWKALLYKHRDRGKGTKQMLQNQFALSAFAPPPESAFAPPPSAFAPPPRSPPRPPVQDQTGDEAFARRLALSEGQPPQPPSPPPPPPRNPTPPPPSDSAVISRPPVRYTQPSDVREGEDDEMDSPPPILGSAGDEFGRPQRSTRPGQAGFAYRFMNKYGWTEGTGLGADESGILNPLRAQVEKRRKKADADGGGWAEPGSKGKILGGRRKEEQGKFGKMSEVVVLRNMLENMPDLQTEISEGLGQEIGEECGEKYGRVERLYIDQEARQVFMKFTDQVSALRAVTELDGRIFNGNTIIPKFYDADKFEEGVYTST
ncbi:Splicing factor 45 [Tolypocladium ophioglossoides CBS 100239]|uniref:Splicing factor 45 n=1 Tax=Tolypocladium ophioglossoides (strain CBS 100239) TaxID=1163406 RepID=A0A0L0NCQ7_TOLOC|nr:Splicing factor 45 [Tolypocladium ophioglossoides CBS 100239]